MSSANWWINDLNRGLFFWIMVNTLLGIKLNQFQKFSPEGKRIPVTAVQAGPCWITQINDGRAQLAFGSAKHITKALSGSIKKTGLDIKPRFLREVAAPDLGDLTVGSQIKVGDVFAVGDKIRVTGTSKGKGFAGVVKRHGFAGGPRTHGQSDRERAPGSIGQTTTPGRVYRGKRMAGRMGNERVTVKGLSVVDVNSETNTLLIAGLVPGRIKGLLIIAKG